MITVCYNGKRDKVNSILEWVQEHGMSEEVQKLLCGSSDSFNEWFYEHHDIHEYIQKTMHAATLAKVDEINASIAEKYERFLTDSLECCDAQGIEVIKSKNFGECPHCGSYDHDEHEIEYEADYILHMFACGKCGSQWVDHTATLLAGWEYNGRIYDCEGEDKGEA